MQSDFQPLQVRDGFSRRPLYRLQDGLTSVRIVPRISLEKSPELERGASDNAPYHPHKKRPHYRRRLVII